MSTLSVSSAVTLSPVQKRLPIARPHFAGFQNRHTPQPAKEEKHPNRSAWSHFLLAWNLGLSWAVAIPCKLFPSLDLSRLAQKIESTQIFRPRKFKRAAIANDPILAQGQFLSFSSKDNTRLSAWFKPPMPGKPVILLAHGRGDNMKTITPILNAWQKKGYGLFAVDYRGYGLSQGQPTEHGVYDDLEAASDYLAKQLGYPSQASQILLGHSLGGAVAVEMATTRTFKAVVIASTFTSIAEQIHYTKHIHRGGNTPQNRAYQVTMPDWLIDIVFKSQFDSLKKVQQIKSPTLFIHGAKDEIIPPKFAVALFNQCTADRRQLMILPHQTHDQMSKTKWAGPFVDAVESFIETL